MRKILPIMIFALLAFAGAVAAVDANGDGKVTLDELTDHKLEQVPFAARDRSLDGYLDPVELPELTNNETLTLTIPITTASFRPQNTALSSRTLPSPRWPSALRMRMTS